MVVQVRSTKWTKKWIFEQVALFDTSKRMGALVRWSALFIVGKFVWWFAQKWLSWISWFASIEPFEGQCSFPGSCMKSSFMVLPIVQLFVAPLQVGLSPPVAFRYIKAVVQLKLEGQCDAPECSRMLPILVPFRLTTMSLSTRSTAILSGDTGFSGIPSTNLLLPDLLDQLIYNFAFIDPPFSMLENVSDLVRVLSPIQTGLMNTLILVTLMSASFSLSLSLSHTHTCTWKCSPLAVSIQSG